MSLVNRDTALSKCAAAAGNFAAFSQFLAAYYTWDFTGSPLSGQGTWCLLPTTPSMLPTSTKHFNRAADTQTGHEKVIECHAWPSKVIFFLQNQPRQFIFNC